MKKREASDPRSDATAPSPDREAVDAVASLGAGIRRPQRSSDKSVDRWNTEPQRNRYRNRAVFNEWLLYAFVQMLTYKCQRSGKELVVLDERNTSKRCSGCGRLQPMPLWKRTYRCPHEECRLVMDRDENSAINILKRFLARRGPHTGDPVRCADVFTAIEHVTTFEHV